MKRLRWIFWVSVISVVPITLLSMAAARPADSGEPEPMLMYMPAEQESPPPETEDKGRDSEADADSTDSVDSTDGDGGLWLTGEKNQALKDAEVQVSLICGDEIRLLALDDYLTGVVAAEMPASFRPEALKAQAVAARTYCMYRMKTEPAHENGALCSNPGCCKAYMDNEALRKKWGGDYEKNIELMKQAVEQTDGICVLYDAQPILAAFHSSSCGSTESSENVWSGALPYLKSVESTENSAVVPNYYSQAIFSLEEFARLAQAQYPSVALEGEAENWLSGAEYSQSGRLKSVLLGSLRISGTQLRTMLSLRSAAMTWEITPEGILFLVTGYGHGVGMSQYGANEMAKNGADYTEILAHYYTGTVLGCM